METDNFAQPESACAIDIVHTCTDWYIHPPVLVLVLCCARAHIHTYVKP